MIDIIGTMLYQWDTGRSIKVTDSSATHVHFANVGDSQAVIMELAESQALIPDYLLQTGKQLCVYAVANGVTIEHNVFAVKKRERPENYIYDEDYRNFIYVLIQSAEEAIAKVEKIVDELKPVKTVNGVEPDENGNVAVEVAGGTATAIDYDQNVKAINHRGYSTTAPENTIPAYILSKQKGFTYVEADISFTSDDVPVLLHDSTIDRTSNGSGSVSAMTYAEVSQYDFGSWKSSAYTGTRIPTFEEFIILCKRIALHPYIELKTGTESQIAALVDTVKKCGMQGKVTYISFSSAALGYIKNADNSARLGYLADVTESTIATALSLKTEDNEVFMDVARYHITDEKVLLCVENNLPLEIWTVNDVSQIKALNPYVTGVTSDNLIAGKVLYDAGMVYEYTPGSGGGEEPEEPDVPDTPVVPDKTLSNISATYSGGDVAVGTAVTALTGIVVTATYSDGSTATVTGYTLSGTIAEGSNTVTVSYGGKTTTFTVTGVAESGGADGELLYNWDFTKSLTDTVTGATVTLMTNPSESVVQAHNLSAPTRDANGINFTGKAQCADFGQIYEVDRTYEIDVAKFDFKGTTSSHCRFVMFGYEHPKSTGAGSDVDSGIVWRCNKNPGWSGYNHVEWASNYFDDMGGTGMDTINYFNGKTVALHVDANGYITMYVDGVNKGTLSNQYTKELLKGNTDAGRNYFRIGNVGSFLSGDPAAKGAQLYDVTISGVRIYRGLKVN